MNKKIKKFGLFWLATFVIGQLLQIAYAYVPIVTVSPVLASVGISVSLSLIAFFVQSFLRPTRVK